MSRHGQAPASSGAVEARRQVAAHGWAGAFLALLIATPMVAHAQDEGAGTRAREGFYFGVALGAGAISMMGSGVEEGLRLMPSFPNLRLGYMLSNRTGLLLLLPGTLYKYRGNTPGDRPRYRGLEAILPSLQHWVGDRWWVMAGAGLALDAPAFFDVEDPSEGRFQLGPAVSVGTGYEVWRLGRFSSDIQGRVHYGRARLPDGHSRGGLALNLLVGLNVD